MSRNVARTPEEDTETRHVGEAVPRTDAPAKVSGDAIFTMDLAPGGLLHAKLVTSPYAHARIESIDTSDAEALEGVHAVATHEDAPDTRRGQFILDQPILAKEKVRHIGEPVAIVAAETTAIAEQAASLVDVRYDRLDGVFDLEAAFERDPPAVVHDDVREYQFATQGDPRYAKRGHVDDHDADRPNVLYKDHANMGDVDTAFEQADHVIEGTYETNPISHCAMEPHIAIAQSRSDGTTIWTSQQVPHNIETEVCMAFPDLSPADLTVKTPFVGGGFGGKITPFLETMLLVVAQKVSRPVRLQFTRAEEFTSGVSRPQVITTIRDGVSDDGDLVAREAVMKFNCGAYNEQVFRCTCSGPSALVGSYDIPNVRWDSYAVYTNKPMFAAFRGFGKPEVNWAVERHMDHVAGELGLDPVEYRRRNLLREGDTNAKGETLGANDTDGVLDTPVTALRNVDPASEYPDYDSTEWTFATGIAYGSKPVSRAASAVTVYVKKNMVVEVHAGAPDIGQGSDTMLTQIAAEEFSVPMENVRLVTGDTDRTPYDRGPTGSRFTYHTGNALRKAAADAKVKLFAEASRRIDGDVDETDLEIAGEQIRDRTNPDRAVHVNDLFSNYGQQLGVSNTMLESGGELIGTATYDAREGGVHHAFWTPVAQGVLVAINRVTGQVDILRVVTGCDVGRAINPKNVEQQLEGAAAQSLSTAVYEQVTYDGGRVTNPNFKDYAVPGITELPYENETVLFESRDDEGPYGAKGVGEAGMMAAAPAVGNALSNALGEAFDTIPVTPEDVLEALGD